MEKKKNLYLGVKEDIELKFIMVPNHDFNIFFKYYLSHMYAPFFCFIFFCQLKNISSFKFNISFIEINILCILNLFISANMAAVDANKFPF